MGRWTRQNVKNRIISDKKNEERRIQEEKKEVKLVGQLQAKVDRTTIEVNHLTLSIISNRSTVTIKDNN